MGAAQDPSSRGRPPRTADGAAQVRVNPRSGVALGGRGGPKAPGESSRAAGSTTWEGNISQLIHPRLVFSAHAARAGAGRVSRPDVGQKVAGSKGPLTVQEALAAASRASAAIEAISAAAHDRFASPRPLPRKDGPFVLPRSREPLRRHDHDAEIQSLTPEALQLLLSLRTSAAAVRDTLASTGAAAGAARDLAPTPSRGRSRERANVPVAASPRSPARLAAGVIPTSPAPDVGSRGDADYHRARFTDASDSPDAAPAAPRAKRAPAAAAQRVRSASAAPSRSAPTAARPRHRSASAAPARAPRVRTRSAREASPGARASGRGGSAREWGVSGPRAAWEDTHRHVAEWAAGIRKRNARGVAKKTLVPALWSGREVAAERRQKALQKEGREQRRVERAIKAACSDEGGGAIANAPLVLASLRAYDRPWTTHMSRKRGAEQLGGGRAGGDAGGAGGAGAGAGGGGEDAPAARPVTDDVKALLADIARNPRRQYAAPWQAGMVKRRRPDAAAGAGAEANVGNANAGVDANASVGVGAGKADVSGNALIGEGDGEVGAGVDLNDRVEEGAEARGSAAEGGVEEKGGGEKGGRPTRAEVRERFLARLAQEREERELAAFERAYRTARFQTVVSFLNEAHLAQARAARARAERREEERGGMARDGRQWKDILEPKPARRLRSPTRNTISPRRYAFTPRSAQASPSPDASPRVRFPTPDPGMAGTAGHGGSPVVLGQSGRAASPVLGLGQGGRAASPVLGQSGRVLQGQSGRAASPVLGQSVHAGGSAVGRPPLLRGGSAGQLSARAGMGQGVSGQLSGGAVAGRASASAAAGGQLSVGASVGQLPSSDVHAERAGMGHAPSTSSNVRVQGTAPSPSLPIGVAVDGNAAMGLSRPATMDVVQPQGEASMQALVTGGGAAVATGPAEVGGGGVGGAGAGAELGGATGATATVAPAPATAPAQAVIAFTPQVPVPAPVPALVLSESLPESMRVDQGFAARVARELMALDARLGELAGAVPRLQAAIADARGGSTSGSTSISGDASLSGDVSVLSASLVSASVSAPPSASVLAPAPRAASRSAASDVGAPGHAGVSGISGGSSIPDRVPASGPAPVEGSTAPESAPESAPAPRTSKPAPVSASVSGSGSEYSDSFVSAVSASQSREPSHAAAASAGGDARGAPRQSHDANVLLPGDNVLLAGQWGRGLQHAPGSGSDHNAGGVGRVGGVSGGGGGGGAARVASLPVVRSSSHATATVSSSMGGDDTGMDDDAMGNVAVTDNDDVPAMDVLDWQSSVASSVFQREPRWAPDAALRRGRRDGSGTAALAPELTVSGALPESREGLTRPGGSSWPSSGSVSDTDGDLSQSQPPHLGQSQVDGAGAVGRRRRRVGEGNNGASVDGLARAAHEMEMREAASAPVAAGEGRGAGAVDAATGAERAAVLRAGLRAAFRGYAAGLRGERGQVAGRKRTLAMAAGGGGVSGGGGGSGNGVGIGRPPRDSIADALRMQMSRGVGGGGARGGVGAGAMLPAAISSPLAASLRAFLDENIVAAFQRKRARVEEERAHQMARGGAGAGAGAGGVVGVAHAATQATGLGPAESLVAAMAVADDDAVSPAVSMRVSEFGDTSRGGDEGSTAVGVAVGVAGSAVGGGAQSSAAVGPAGAAGSVDGGSGGENSAAVAMSATSQPHVPFMPPTVPPPTSQHVAAREGLRAGAGVRVGDRERDGERERGGQLGANRRKSPGELEREMREAVERLMVVEGAHVDLESLRAAREVAEAQRARQRAEEEARAASREAEMRMGAARAALEDRALALSGQAGRFESQSAIAIQKDKEEREREQGAVEGLARAVGVLAAQGAAQMEAIAVQMQLQQEALAVALTKTQEDRQREMDAAFERFAALQRDFAMAQADVMAKAQGPMQELMGRLMEGLTQSQALAAVRPLQPALRRIDAAAAAAATHVDNIRKSMGSDTDQAIDDDNVRRSIGGDGHATGAGLQRDGAGAGAGAGANVGSKPKAGSSGVITSGSASVSGRMGEAGEGSVSVVESEGVGGVGARGAGAIGGGVAGEGSSDWIVDSESEPDIFKPCSQRALPTQRPLNAPPPIDQSIAEESALANINMQKSQSGVVESEVAEDSALHYDAPQAMQGGGAGVAVSGVGVAMEVDSDVDIDEGPLGQGVDGVKRGFGEYSDSVVEDVDGSEGGMGAGVGGGVVGNVVGEGGRSGGGVARAGGVGAGEVVGSGSGSAALVPQVRRMLTRELSDRAIALGAGDIVDGKKGGDGVAMAAAGAGTVLSASGFADASSLDELAEAVLRRLMESARQAAAAESAEVARRVEAVRAAWEVARGEWDARAVDNSASEEERSYARREGRRAELAAEAEMAECRRQSAEIQVRLHSHRAAMARSLPAIRDAVRDLLQGTTLTTTTSQSPSTPALSPSPAPNAPDMPHAHAPAHARASTLASTQPHPAALSAAGADGSGPAAATVAAGGTTARPDSAGGPESARGVAGLYPGRVRGSIPGDDNSVSVVSEVSSLGGNDDAGLSLTRGSGGRASEPAASVSVESSSDLGQPLFAGRAAPITRANNNISASNDADQNNKNAAPVVASSDSIVIEEEVGVSMGADASQSGAIGSDYDQSDFDGTGVADGTGVVGAGAGVAGEGAGAGTPLPGDLSESSGLAERSGELRAALADARRRRDSLAARAARLARLAESRRELEGVKREAAGLEAAIAVLGRAAEGQAVGEGELAAAVAAAGGVVVRAEPGLPAMGAESGASAAPVAAVGQRPIAAAGAESASVIPANADLAPPMLTAAGVGAGVAEVAAGSGAGQRVADSAASAAAGAAEGVGSMAAEGSGGVASAGVGVGVQGGRDTNADVSISEVSIAESIDLDESLGELMSGAGLAEWVGGARAGAGASAGVGVERGAEENAAGAVQAAALGFLARKRLPGLMMGDGDKATAAVTDTATATNAATDTADVTAADAVATDAATGIATGADIAATATAAAARPAPAPVSASLSGSAPVSESSVSEVGTDYGDESFEDAGDDNDDNIQVDKSVDSNTERDAGVAVGVAVGAGVDGPSGGGGVDVDKSVADVDDNAAVDAAAADVATGALTQPPTPPSPLLDRDRSGYDVSLDRDKSGYDVSLRSIDPIDTIIDHPSAEQLGAAGVGAEMGDVASGGVGEGGSESGDGGGEGWSGDVGSTPEGGRSVMSEEGSGGGGAGVGGGAGGVGVGGGAGADVAGDELGLPPPLSEESRSRLDVSMAGARAGEASYTVDSLEPPDEEGMLEGGASGVYGEEGEVVIEGEGSLELESEASLSIDAPRSDDADFTSNSNSNPNAPPLFSVHSGGSEKFAMSPPRNDDSASFAMGVANTGTAGSSGGAGGGDPRALTSGGPALTQSVSEGVSRVPEWRSREGGPGAAGEVLVDELMAMVVDEAVGAAVGAVVGKGRGVGALMEGLVARHGSALDPPLEQAQTSAMPRSPSLNERRGSGGVQEGDPSLPIVDLSLPTIEAYLDRVLHCMATLGVHDHEGLAEWGTRDYLEIERGGDTVSDHQHMVHKAIFDAATEAVLLHQAKALPGRYPRGVMGDRVTPVAVRGVVGGVGVGVGLAGGVGASAGAGMGGGASGAASGAMDDADTTTATGAGVGVGASMSAGAGVGASAGVGSGVLAMARETVLGWARQGAAFPDMFAPAGSGPLPEERKRAEQSMVQSLVESDLTQSMPSWLETSEDAVRFKVALADAIFDDLIKQVAVEVGGMG